MTTTEHSLVMGRYYAQLAVTGQKKYFLRTGSGDKQVVQQV